MAIQRKELTKYLNNLLNVYEFSDYAPNGLQIEGANEIKKIAFSVSATVESVEKCCEWGADALIVHHGVFWKHQGARPVTGAHYKRIGPLIKNDINLYGFHLPLDGHIEHGNAAGIAKALKLKNIAPFGEYKKTYVGVKGEFDQKLSAKELQDKLQDILGRDVLLASDDDSRTVKGIGIITGGANNDWPQALKQGLDCYLTGEISEYNWHDAIEEGIHYYAGGHHATERFGVLSLQKHLEEEFKVETLFIDSDNPV